MAVPCAKKGKIFSLNKSGRPPRPWGPRIGPMDGRLMRLLMRCRGVQPTNTMERSFAIGVLLFALLVFSSFVASLTGAREPQFLAVKSDQTSRS